MLQKRNEFEIIELLRKESLHLREIAKKLRMIPSTVMRILSNLRKENVVDFKVEGRNNKYFLKDTIESQQYLLMTEQYKLLQLINNPLLRRTIQEIRKKTKNELVILFGSYVKGQALKNSDIDVYIETKNRRLKKNIEEISSKLSVKIGEFNKNSLLIKEIIKNHVIIQNVGRFYKLIK
jgi:predicted nucleotidyltransferase